MPNILRHHATMYTTLLIKVIPRRSISGTQSPFCSFCCSSLSGSTSIFVRKPDICTKANEWGVKLVPQEHLLYDSHSLTFFDNVVCGRRIATSLCCNGARNEACMSFNRITQNYIQSCQAEYYSRCTLYGYYRNTTLTCG